MDIKEIWESITNGVKKSFALIVLVLGIIALSYSIWGTFVDSRWKELWGSIGKLSIASGLFTFLVKSFQFSGIFKSELTKIIFEPRFLANRKDLSEFWEKVSVELFKHKFPSISQKLLKDIREKYMPTKDVMYYDDSEHIIEIKLIDVETGEAEVTQEYIINAISSKRDEDHLYEFDSAYPFKNEPTEGVFTCEMSINGEVSEPTHKQIVKNNVVYNEYKITLKGSEKYIIKRRNVLKYNIYYDNIIYFLANRMYHKLKVEIHYPKDVISVELKKCGTLDNFTPLYQNNHLQRYICNGIIYPEQGYYLNIKKI